MWHRARSEDPLNASCTAGGRRRRIGPASAAAMVLAIAVLGAAGALPAFAATARGPALTFGATLSPLAALIAGFLILLIPRLLNFIVAIYLIVVGLIGLVGR